MASAEELAKTLEQKTALVEALQEKVRLLEALVATRDASLAGVTDGSAIPEAIPGTSGEAETLTRMASVAKYDGLLSRADLSEEDRCVVQRVRDLREGGTSVSCRQSQRIGLPSPAIPVRRTNRPSWGRLSPNILLIGSVV